GEPLRCGHRLIRGPGLTEERGGLGPEPARGRGRGGTRREMDVTVPPGREEYGAPALRSNGVVPPFEQLDRGPDLAAGVTRADSGDQVRLHPIGQDDTHAVLEPDDILERELLIVVDQLE